MTTIYLETVFCVLLPPVRITVSVSGSGMEQAHLSNHCLLHVITPVMSHQVKYFILKTTSLACPTPSAVLAAGQEPPSSRLPQGWPQLTCPPRHCCTTPSCVTQVPASGLNWAQLPHSG